jgi:hypothetical protein
LHIEAYHSQINNRKEENKQHIKIPNRNLQKQGRKIKKKVSYFIKEMQNRNVNTSSPRHTRKTIAKSSKKQVTQN